MLAPTLFHALIYFITTTYALPIPVYTYRKFVALFVRSKA
jgi:hypothetical protein